MEEVQCEKKFVKSTKEDVTANGERLKRSDIMIDIVASSIIRLSNTVPNSESVPEFVNMNGKTYRVIDGQEEKVAELTKVLSNCIDPGKPLFPNGKKPILLVNPEDSEDSYIYVPIATDAQSPARGIYLKVDKQRKAAQPIGSFVTASCLFGSQTLMGIDPDGKHYSLLDTTKNPVPEGIRIIKVRPLNDTHIYERAMWEAYETIAHLIKHHRNAKPRVMHLLADVEYYLYGLTYLVGGVFSREAFEQYISAVNVRGALHREKILEIYTRNGIEVNFNFNSPFRYLDLSGKSAKEVIAKFVALFADKGVNTIEDLSCKITLDDLLVKLKATFNYDPAIAALKSANIRNQQYLKSEKAKVKAKKSDANSEVCSELNVLDKVGIDLSAISLDLQDKINPWHLENFEPVLHNLVESKEKHPTPSEMFSIVSSLSEVARVEMSVIENPNERVCVIFESQQVKTLKVFKRIFPAHAQKLCAYVYQLPLATQDRPIFHVEDCPAVTGDLISNISKLYYLNGKERDELKWEMNEYLKFCNSQYDSYLLDVKRDFFYCCSENGSNSVMISYLGGRCYQPNIGVIYRQFSWFLKKNIEIMREKIELPTKEISDQQLLGVLCRLAKRIVYVKNYSQKNPVDPLEFCYWDGDVDDYVKNGRGVHYRYIWQFDSGGPVLDKEQRERILKNLPLLEHVKTDVGGRITLRFRSAVILAFLYCLEFDEEDYYSKNGPDDFLDVVQKKFFYYFEIALVVRERNPSIPIQNFFLEKLNFSGFCFASDYSGYSLFDHRWVFLEGIALFNFLNFISFPNSHYLSIILEEKITKFLRYDHDDIQYRNENWGRPAGSYDSKETDFSRVYRFRKIYRWLSDCWQGLPDDLHRLFDHIKYSFEKKSKEIVSHSNRSITYNFAECNDGGIDYIHQHWNTESDSYYLFIKRVGCDLALLQVEFSKKTNTFTPLETPLRSVIEFPRYSQILNQSMTCPTFIQDRASKETHFLKPGKVLLGIGVNSNSHAYLYAHALSEAGSVSFAIFEIVHSRVLGYCRLVETYAYSASTSKQDNIAALERLVKNRREKITECIGCESRQKDRNLQYSDLLHELRSAIIINMKEFNKMRDYITLMFYRDFSKKIEDELIYPFVLVGGESFLSQSEYRRIYLETKNMYGDKMQPINCFDFCRNAIYAIENEAIIKEFQDIPWLLKKCINHPGVLKQRVTFNLAFFENNGRFAEINKGRGETKKTDFTMK